MAGFFSFSTYENMADKANTGQEARTLPAAGSVIPFLRKRDYILTRELGRGACGETVLLYDDVIESHFVCKKYSPINEAFRQELFKNFLREIKLLHEVHHHNVVRVFNYYVYPERQTGFILMEYVDGYDIEEHLKAKPETLNDVFVQVVSGFQYLERSQILHRDIRPKNLLVRTDGVVKIIDLGFGKRVQGDADFGKSITLNWWCEPPQDFGDGTYDHRTEVYFVGKLFEQLIQQLGLKGFQYTAVLRDMCRADPADRVASFAEVQNSLEQEGAKAVQFAPGELLAYRNFSDIIGGALSKIENRAKYATDLEEVKTKLEEVHHGCMLENQLGVAPILRVLIKGQFYYFTKRTCPTKVLRNFLDLLQKSSPEKQRIALANLHTRFATIPKYEEPPDDIPF